MTPDDFLFDPIAALRVLAHHGVRFVLIGGLAGRAHGSPLVTNDLDICYARDDENLEHLASALKELRATLRGAPRDLPFTPDPPTLRAGDHFTFDTTAGPLDCLGHPAGTKGYDELVHHAQQIDLGGASVLLVGLDDLIHMKLAAGRAKDREAAEHLAALRDEIEGRSQR